MTHKVDKSIIMWLLSVHFNIIRFDLMSSLALQICLFLFQDQIWWKIESLSKRRDLEAWLRKERIQAWFKADFRAKYEDWLPTYRARSCSQMHWPCLLSGFKLVTCYEFDAFGIILN